MPIVIWNQANLERFRSGGNPYFLHWDFANNVVNRLKTYELSN